MALQRGTTIVEEHEKVELFISCRKLKNMDVLSLTDPQVKLHVEKNGKWVFFDQTEMISDNLNPDFAKSFIMDFYFEVKQKLRFEIIDIDGPNQSELVGEVFTTLGEIVGSKNQTAMYDILCKGKKTGKLIIKCEKVARNASSVFLEFHGDNLKNVEGFFGKSNPVLKLSRAAGDSGFVVVYESEILKKNLNPIWKGFEIKVQKLCNSDYYRPIKAEVFSRAGFKDTLIGECQFTLDELKDQEMRQFTLTNPRKDKDKKYGVLRLRQFSIIEKPDFLDYIRGGVQLSVILAIDFTGSNGDPTFPNSLHAIKFDGTMNEYQKAIYGVCGILLDYDYDKKIPAFGFGGKPNFPNYKSSTVQHCFPLTGNPNDPWSVGLDGIMGSYSYALQNTGLSGPTLFAPILQQAMKVAQENKMNGSNEYTILLIITDGEIHDMEPTINCLIKSARLPLSVIIVGVGSADFTNMEILDGDDGLANSNGVKAERDLVQFVPFRNVNGSPEELAKHVLEEVPDQLVEYMTFEKIKPRPPMMIDVEALYQAQGTMSTMPNLEDNKQMEPRPQRQTMPGMPTQMYGSIGMAPQGNYGGYPEGQVGRSMTIGAAPQNVQLNFEQGQGQNFNNGMGYQGNPGIPGNQMNQGYPGSYNPNSIGRLGTMGSQQRPY